MVTSAHLKFKDARLAREWEDKRLSDFLREIVSYLAEQRYSLLRIDSIVTSIYRTKQENVALDAGSQTHPEWRAVDVRVAPEFLVDEMGLRTQLLKRYPTDLKRMPRVSPLDHGTALHFHIQETRAEHAANVKEK